MKTLLLGLFLFIFSIQELHARCECDYIVVGVGTAGAVMARRLTDDKKTSVVALHSGENLSRDPLIALSENAKITVPAAIIGPPLYENGLTIPQTSADGRNLLWAIALPFGGASAVNAGAYCRGTNELYAQWEAIAGPLWSVSRILSIYKDLETYKGNTPNPIFRGENGPISVLQDPTPTQVSVKFTQALTLPPLNFPFVIDYNDPLTPIGASTQFQYTRRGEEGIFRVSSATAFLNGSVMTSSGWGRHQRKLRVVFNSTALRTIWEGNRAVGVEFLLDGKVQRVFARKGVVVCAGLKSSFFLLHSGVGSSALLQSLNIPVIVNNPNVGLGLADQPAIRTIFTSNLADTPLESINFFASISWLPDTVPGIREFRFSTITPGPGIVLGSMDLCQPRSRGSLSINSANPLDPPVIDLGALSNPQDMALFLNFFQNIINPMVVTLHAIDPNYDLVYPDLATRTNPVLLQAFIRENIASNEHFQSHCRMAPLNQGGVVDSTGLVYGTQNLYVADDSVVPLCMDGSPMASAYLIAENIARMLIQASR